MGAAISTDRLTKDYAVGFWRPRPYRALDSLSLSVGTGEVFGFLGPNGAGKTTTLKLLMQLVFPTSGSAEILGRPVGDVAVKRRIGYLPENPYFYDYLTAEELLRYFARLFGFSAAESRQRASRWLDEVQIGAERRLQLRKFSKGMLQRVGIAQALLNDPEVVFLDEPMSGLDPIGRRDVRQLILRLRDEGRTVFFSSHILSDAETLCSRVAVLARGRMMASGALNEILAFRARGWEVVVETANPEACRALSPAPRRVEAIDGGRTTLEFGPEWDAASLVGAISASGASVRVPRAAAGVPRGLLPPAGQQRRLGSDDVMRTLTLIAVNVFRESVRDKVLYNLVAFAVLLIGVSLLIGQLTAGQEVKIIKDLGLASVSVFGTFIAVFIGIGLVSKEVERRSIYALIAKPMSRPQLVLGKFAGLALTLAVNVGIMTAAIYAVLAGWHLWTPQAARAAWEAPALDPALLIAIALIYLELLVVTAIAIVFSTYSSAILSAAFTFGIVVAGHFGTDLKNFDQVTQSPAAQALARAFYYLLPNLSFFDVKARVVHADPVLAIEVWLAIAYAAVYVAALLTLAIWIFSRRDFK